MSVRVYCLNSTHHSPDDRQTTLHVCFALPLNERYTPSTGGAIATVTRNLARELASLGHRTTILAPTDGAACYPEGEVIPLHYGPSYPAQVLRRKVNTLHARHQGWVWPDYGPYLRSLRRAFRSMDSRLDVVIAANDPVLARIVTERLPKVIPVLWLHNLMEVGDTVGMAQIPAKVRLVAVSNFVADWTADRYGLDRSRISVAHNGVDTALFRPRDDYARPSHPVKVICHGRIDPNKGHDIAARAVSRLRMEGLEVTLTLVGNVQTFGWDDADVSRYTAELKTDLGDADAEWLGRLPPTEVAQQLRAHDVSCVLSRSQEPFALVSLEAMASGCAIIASRSGGIPEVVQGAGTLVEREAVDQVVDALRVLVKSSPAMVAAKDAALSAAARFTWANTARGLLQAVLSRSDAVDVHGGNA